MAPPLIQLKDIRLTFGGTPLLSGVELSVSSGERVCLIGRNGSGKSTLLKIAAGLIEADRGTRFLQPGTTVRYLPQEPDFGDFPRRLWPLSRPASAPATTLIGPAIFSNSSDSRATRSPANVSAARLAARRWRRSWPPRRIFCCWTSRPTISTCRRSMAGSRTGKHAVARSSSSAMTGVSSKTFRAHHLARPWPDPADRQGFWPSRPGATRSGGRERDRHKLDRKLVNEDHWLRYGVTGRRKRNYAARQSARAARPAAQ